MRGIPVGTVDDVVLTPQQVRVTWSSTPESRYQPERRQIVRRSPIGELTIELLPGEGAAAQRRNDRRCLHPAPSDVSKTIEVLADVLHEVPSEDLTTVVHELSEAVDGRSEDIARFSEDAADLPERILEVQEEPRNLT